MFWFWPPLQFLDFAWNLSISKIQFMEHFTTNFPIKPYWGRTQGSFLNCFSKIITFTDQYIQHKIFTLSTNTLRKMKQPSTDFILTVVNATLIDSQFAQRVRPILWLFQRETSFPYLRTSIWKILLCLWITSLVQLSHYITTALWWEWYSTPTHLSFEPSGFVRGAPSSLIAPHRSKSPQPVSALLVSNYRRSRRWGSTVHVCVCVWASASVHKGLSRFNMQKRCQVCDYTSW